MHEGESETEHSIIDDDESAHRQKVSISFNTPSGARRVKGAGPGRALHLAAQPWLGTGRAIGIKSSRSADVHADFKLLLFRKPAGSGLPESRKRGQKEKSIPRIVCITAFQRQPVLIDR